VIGPVSFAGYDTEDHSVGALPKKKVSRRRRDNRRSHDGLTVVSLINCPNCRRPVPNHQACPSCGQYRGRQVLKVAPAGATS
jgi:large subunit ribosomal protein L32